MTPGPGHYDENKNLDFIKYRPRSALKLYEPRFVQKKIDNTPGPGTYRTKKDFVDDIQKTVILSTKEPRV